jgi:hypothetical protein
MTPQEITLAVAAMDVVNDISANTLDDLRANYPDLAFLIDAYEDKVELLDKSVLADDYKQLEENYDRLSEELESRADQIRDMALILGRMDKITKHDINQLANVADDMVTYIGAPK